MVVAKKWVKKIGDDPKEFDCELQEEQLPPLKDGDVLFEALYIPIDPVVKLTPIPAGQEILGEQIAKVMESKHAKYKVGGIYVCEFGWRSHTVINPDKPESISVPIWFPYNRIRPAPDLGGLPISLALGTIGMTGATAYLGLIKCLNPQPGETLLVNSAAGSVGNVVGQVAKILGCKVIGFAGSDEKLKWLEELGFDYVYNYKTCNLEEALKESAPNGVDCYYDSVGGDFTTTVLQHGMAKNGRVVVVGAISAFSGKPQLTGPYPYLFLISKGLSLKGYTVNSDTMDEWNDAFTKMIAWIHEGKLKYKEHVTQGFEKLPQALTGLLNGDNIGKAVVKV